MIKIRIRNHLHASGSKFYETVLITCEATDTAALVKRFGKVSVKLGGGQMMCHEGDVRSMTDEMSSTWAKKGKRGEYTEDNPGSDRITERFLSGWKEAEATVVLTRNDEHCIEIKKGRFSAATPTSSSSLTTIQEELILALGAHYSDKHQAETIVNMLRIGSTSTKEDDDRESIVIHEPEEPAVDRGTEWATW